LVWGNNKRRSGERSPSMYPPGKKILWRWGSKRNGGVFKRSGTQTKTREYSYEHQPTISSCPKTKQKGGKKRGTDLTKNLSSFNVHIIRDLEGQEQDIK